SVLVKNQTGKFRTADVVIADAATGARIEDCPPHFKVSALMDDVWSWLKETEGQNPFARAFAFHFLTVAVHPFADGNGRTSRLMHHYMLLKEDEQIARFVPSETAIYSTRDRYYISIRQSLKLNSLNPILEFLAECFAQAAESCVKDAKEFLKHANK